MKYIKSKWLWLLALLFIAACAIDKPILLYPTGGEAVSLPVTLVWSHVKPSEYWVMIDTTTDFYDPIVWVRISDTTYEINNLPARMYYWYVEAHTEDLSSYSETDSFRIE